MQSVTNRGKIVLMHANSADIFKKLHLHANSDTEACKTSEGYAKLLSMHCEIVLLHTIVVLSMENIINACKTLTMHCKIVSKAK
jgi:hypothetical protein